MRRRDLLPCLLFALLPLLLPGALPAQQTTGTVKGSVVDADGKGVELVDVFLQPQAPGRPTLTTNTDLEGNFRFVGVPVDTYNLYSFQVGFTSDRIENINVNPGATSTHIVRLLSAERKVETIVVDYRRSRFEQIEVEQTVQKTVVDAAQISRLPLQNRRIQDIVFTMAGVSRTGSSDSTDISVAGGTSAQIKYILDGANFTDVLGGGPIADVSSLAIERFELIRGGFQAEYGQQSTGIGNMITKSGSNEVEFAYQVTLRDVSLLGAELPGLVAAQEGWQGLVGADYFEWVKKQIVEGLGAPLATYDDDSNPAPRTRIQHQMGVGGPIVLDKVFFYTNLDVLRDDYGSAFVDYMDQVDKLSYLGKITWEVNQNNRLRAELNVARVQDTGSNDIQTPPENSVNSEDGAWTFTLHERHNFQGSEGFFNDKSFIETSFNVSHRYLTARPVDKSAIDETNLFLPPGGAVTYNLLGAGEDSDLSYTDYRITTAATKSKEKHNVKFGGELGFIDFKGTIRRQPTYNDLRLAFGEFLPVANTALSLGQLVDSGPAQEEKDTTWLADLYVQDLWQLTSNLTIEPGLRLDWQEFVDRTFIAPRVGVSWAPWVSPDGSRKTQVTANWGHFYDNIFLNALIYARQPAVTTYEVFRGPDAPQSVEFKDIPYFRDIVRLATQDVEASTILVPIVTNYFGLDERLTDPRSTTWSVGLTRVLPKGLRFQANYMERKEVNSLTPMPGEVLRARDLNAPFTPALVKSNLGTGSGLGVHYNAWTLEASRAFANKWGLNASYSRQKATGPVEVPFSTADPLYFGSFYGVLSRDRTEVIKVGSNVELPWKLSLAANYRYQTGTPTTPVIRAPVISALGPGLVATRFQTYAPLGQNSLRLPPDRALDLTFSRKFKRGGGTAFEGRFSIFNVTNEFNVYSALALFEPITDPDPSRNLPLRPTILPLYVDVPRSFEAELRISF